MIKPVFGIWIHVGDDILVSYGVFDRCKERGRKKYYGNNSTNLD
jgi:hypothetical protein